MNCLLQIIAEVYGCSSLKHRFLYFNGIEDFSPTSARLYQTGFNYVNANVRLIRNIFINLLWRRFSAITHVLQLPAGSDLNVSICLATTWSSYVLLSRDAHSSCHFPCGKNYESIVLISALSKPYFQLLMWDVVWSTSAAKYIFTQYILFLAFFCYGKTFAG